MKYEERLFKETPDRRSINHTIARRSLIRPAEIADGTPGVYVRFGRWFGVITETEAIAFSNFMIDAVEEARSNLT